MSALLARIKEEGLVARKARDTAKGAFLTTLYAEAAAVGKNKGNRESDDAETLAVIRKFIKNAEEVLKVRPSDSNAPREIEWARAYLPALASVDDVLAAIVEIKEALGISVPSGKDVGRIMGELKKRFGDRLDAAEAAKSLR